LKPFLLVAITMYGLEVFLYLSLLLGIHSLESVNGEDEFIKWFEDQSKEVLDEPLPITVVGKIPDYINGKLIRVGPTILNTENKNFTNYLDGFGRVTSYTIDGERNQIDFQSAIIRSLLWNASEPDETISRHISQQKTHPVTKPGVFDLDTMDNTDVNIYLFPGSDRILTFTDFYLMNEVHLGSLRTLGSTEFGEGDDVPKAGFFSSSHPCEYTHPETGLVYLVNWLGVKTTHGSDIYIYAMGSDLVRKTIGKVSIDFLPYSIHSISLVDDYVTVVLGPVSLDFLKAGANLCLTCSTHDDLDKDATMLYVFSLASVGNAAAAAATGNLRTAPDVPGPVVTARAPAPDAFFVFHHINGWIEEEEQEKAEAKAKDRNYQHKQHDVKVVGNGGRDINSERRTLILDMCAYDSMDGVLGKNVLGNIDDVQDKHVRDTMPYFCTGIRRVKIPLPRSSAATRSSNTSTAEESETTAQQNDDTTRDVVDVLANVDLPIVDDKGNVYKLELVTVNPLHYGTHHCYLYGATHHVLGNYNHILNLLKPYLFIYLCIYLTTIVRTSFPVSKVTNFHTFHFRCLSCRRDCLFPFFFCLYAYLSLRKVLLDTKIWVSSR